MARSKYSGEQKLNILKIAEESKYTILEICHMYNIKKSTLRNWRTKFKSEGLLALEESNTWKPYTKKLKESAVLDYLEKGLSLREVCDKYKITYDSVLRGWIKKYTSHSELKDSGSGMRKTMTKARKTTLEERLEIVQECMGNGRNYQEAALKHNVSYQQVYSWMKKFEQAGESGLADRRGRTKPEEELTEEEKLKLKIQQMERENERLRAENLFLKKLEDIERRRQ